MATGGSADGPPWRVLVRVAENRSGLEKKLQKYFQSLKKSGGGECTVKAGPSEGTYWVEFLESQARQRVLKRENHELELPGQEKLKLTVRLPPAKNENKISEKPVTTEGRKIKDGAQEQEVSEDQDTKLERRSTQAEGNSEDARTISSLVVFKNVQHTIREDLLTLLVENMSGFSEMNGDFTIEIIPEAQVAVVTFLKTIDTEAFVIICTQNHRVKELKISASTLEMTRTILVEDLPPGVNEILISFFFEHPKNGGGSVTMVQYSPKDNSALIEFETHEVIDTILKKKLLFSNSPISVYPYYPALESALYGQAKPPVKLPHPLTVPMEPYLLKFLQKDDQVIGEITSTMERCYCELFWPQPSCKDPEIILNPSDSLVSQGRTKRNTIKTWNEDVSKRFSDLMSEYQVNTYKVDPLVWEAIRDSIENESILTEFDEYQETMIRVGRLEDMQGTELQVKTQIERATQKIGREKQTIKEKLTVSPGRFSLLHNNKLEETLHKEHSDVEVTYNALTKSICLSGLNTNVYKAKSEILEKLQRLVQKYLHVPPQIVQFLQQVNCETFSESLFRAEKISAIYEVEGEAILLVGSSPQVLSEAEERMHKALDYKCIDVVDSEILNDCQWKTVTDDLNKKYNCSSKTMVIEEQNSDTGVKIMIAGCVSPVCESYQLLCEFIEKNSKVQKFVAVISLAVIEYMKVENEQIWHNLRTKKVKIDFKTHVNQRGILLSGPKEEVMRGVAMVKKIQNSVHVKNVSIDEPGAKDFFKDKEEFYTRVAKQKFNCLIWLQENGEEGNGGSIDGQKIHCKITLESGILLTVQEGDLTQFSADVVVNAANEDLNHCGGLAAALSEAAGPELQRECNQIVQEQGKISPGSAVVSGAGQLPYQQVIHAVGSPWRKEHAQSCVQLLKNAITTSLSIAEFHEHRSIAIPALGSGIFGFPSKDCAEAIILAIKARFQNPSSKHSLKMIHLVDSSKEGVQAFSEAVKNNFEDLSPGNKPAFCMQSENQETNLRKEDTYGKVLTSIKTREGLSILLIKGDIQNAEADIIVNSISLDFPLNGTLSQAILKKAGPSLQEELKTVENRMEMKIGSVLLTSGCNLNCIFVLHAVIPPWDEGKGDSQKIMEDIIRECLETPEILSLTTITVPAIGTGIAKFPKAIFAELILSQVFKFSSTRPCKTLKEVRILLHPRDQENIKAFLNEFSRWTSRSRNESSTSCRVAKTVDGQDFFGTISNTALGVYETTIGSISFIIASGDIAKEQEDVIVNSTSNSFVYKGGVSKAILEAAGRAVELECAALAAKPHDNFIITQGGNLKCKKIIHVLGHEDIKKTVSSVLQECEKMKSKSVSLPAIGTGQAKQDPVVVAKKIIDAVEDFAWKGSAQSVKKVKVVIFLPELLEVFYDSMKRREGSPMPTFMFSKLKILLGLTKHNFVFGKKIKSTIFQICGKSEENIESTGSWIHNLTLKEQESYLTSDELIQNFGEEEFKELNTLQKSLNIIISPRNNFCLQAVGLAKDVIKASQKIEDMMRRVCLRREEDSKAEQLSHFIQWQYNENGVFLSFDKINNFYLEKAREEKKNNVDIKIKNKSYTVNFHTNIATDTKGHSFPVQRVTKSEGVIPIHWADMKQQNLLLVELKPGQQEYMTVKNNFKKTCSNYNIEKIERIQNKSLWNSYETIKKNMNNQNHRTDNERFLFHGTSVDSVPNINNNGFNRSYIKNYAWGKGIYFAVNAFYAASDTYSTPDKHGKKYMYYTRVLTGDYSLGNPSYIDLPPKNTQNPNVLYDSVTNDLQKPTLFVIFRDHQSYPEYLITFRK
ncbi:protein mono-ADP-ribosyltransferase PARP14-like [Gracilinanus agilis]|uniref:protein mono-ADP-ribosyltransferase PARP14-like n=1 Tax=Gracilinanus agilis TaxID=191870 RepID=UPI001CFE28F2|nr:protein mono-ADP-ribosyltransferase PARP14-like [Gracilinanus agilis]